MMISTIVPLPIFLIITLGMVHILQKRDPQGKIKTLERSLDPFSPEYALEKYGPGRYCDKETSPRFQVAWKKWLGPLADQTELSTILSDKIESLDKRTKYLAIGEAIIGAGEILGFGMTAAKLAEYGQRLNRLEALASVSNQRNPLGFVCPVCLQQLSDPLKPFCDNCGDKLDWTNTQSPLRPGDQSCPSCFRPTRPGQRFCNQCGKPLQGPIGQWRLP